MKKFSCVLVVIMLVLLCNCGIAEAASRCCARRTQGPIAVVYSKGASVQEMLAAKEVRRYIYLRTGLFFPIIEFGSFPVKSDVVVIGQKDSKVFDKFITGNKSLSSEIAALQAQQYRIKSVNKNGRNVVLIAGGDSAGTLYGAYRFVEKLGVRFFLHGDVVPDEKISLKLSDIDEKGKPLFNLRGVNPWGTHPYGFDLWNADDYKSVFSQLAKMRMNFLGLHCYPEGIPYAEPTVWIGQKGDFDKDGNVKFSYPSHYYNTIGKTHWGPFPVKNTGDYSFGGSILFERDDWGPDVMQGLTPEPTELEKCNELFNRTSAQLNDAFTFAREIGVKTCVGTETPITIPQRVSNRLQKQGKDPNDNDVIVEVYEGMFERIMKAYPIDYYWVWTTENWLWGNSDAQARKVADDVMLAYRAIKNVNAPFELAAAGWVLGPKDDRTAFDKHLPKNIAMSSLNPAICADPVDPGFGQITGRDKWAIPWIEDDAAMATTQLWVGRTRKDAADALAYGCNGLMGVLWRTRILGPNVSAMAQASWDQSPWNQAPGELPDEKSLKVPAPLVTHSPVDGKEVPSTPITWNEPREALSSDDFYDDWAPAMFGPKAGGDVAALFKKLDGRLPRPTGLPCPCRIVPDERPWDTVAAEYEYVDELARIRPKVKGPGNIERFEYWLNTFEHMRDLAKVQCDLAIFEKAMKKADEQQDAAVKKAIASKEVLPLYRKLLKSYGKAYRSMLESTSTNGGLANIISLEQEATFWPYVVEKSGAKLAKALGTDLPADAIATKEYQGKARLIVPTVRTSLIAGESLKLKVIVLDNDRPRQAFLYWRNMGTSGEFKKIALNHVASGVYKVAVNQPKEDFEYYIKAATKAGKELIYPATAPAMNQTVVVIDDRN